MESNMTDVNEKLTTKLKQIQCKNGVTVQSVNLDDSGNHNLGRIHILIKEMLNMKVSNSVIIRRALFLYRLHFIEGMVNAYDSSKDKADRLDALTEWCTKERDILLTMAGRFDS